MTANWSGNDAGDAGHTQIMPFSSPQARELAITLLGSGRVLALPTDTVYGLMCRYDRDEGLAQLFEIKGRPRDKAIPILIGAFSQLDSLIDAPLPALADRLISCFWPGPLTLVLHAAPGLSTILTAGQSTVAVRMPDHDLLRDLIRIAGPLAATSANLSGQPEARTAEEVVEQIGDDIALILDAIGVKAGTGRPQPSTVIDLTGAIGPTILRAGALADQVAEAIRNEC